MSALLNIHHLHNICILLHTAHSSTLEGQGDGDEWKTRWKDGDEGKDGNEEKDGDEGKDVDEGKGRRRK